MSARKGGKCMSRRVSRVVLVAVVAALSISMLWAQGRRSAGSAPERERAREQRRGGQEETPTLAEALEKGGLSEKERAAVKEAMDRKQSANRELRGQLEALRRVVNDPRAKEEELGRAMETYRAAMRRAETEMTAADRALAAKLSVRSEGKCLALGVLDNGLGRGAAMGGRGGGGGGGRGGGERGDGGRGGGGRGGGGRGGRGGGGGGGAPPSAS